MKFNIFKKEKDKRTFSTFTSPQPTDPLTLNIFCIGDELTKGINVQETESYPSRLSDIGGYLGVSRLGDTGQVVFDTLALADQLRENLISFRRNLCVVWCGANDIFYNPYTSISETVFYVLRSFCSERVAENFGVIVLDMLPRSDAGEDFEIERVRFNNMLRSQWNEFAHNLVELSQVPQLSNPADSTYFDTNGFLLTTAGYDLIAQKVAQAIDTVEMPPMRHIALLGAMNFGTIPAGTTSQQLLQIFNSGIDTLQISSLALPPHFSANWTQGAIGGGDRLNVIVTFAPLAPGKYSGTLSASSNATFGNPLKNITANAV